MAASQADVVYFLTIVLFLQEDGYSELDFEPRVVLATGFLEFHISFLLFGTSRSVSYLLLGAYMTSCLYDFWLVPTLATLSPGSRLSSKQTQLFLLVSPIVSQCCFD